MSATEWSERWDELLTEAGCPMCQEGRPERTAHGIRVFAGDHLDAYAAMRGPQRGYVVAIFRGRHVNDLTDLTPAERRGFLDEVLRVSRAMQQHYQPRKMNYEVLGNGVPHVHAHITARFAQGDIQPGGPLRGHLDVDLPLDVVERDAEPLRD